jgi:3-oxoacyl-[acyl-carrier protein] reductase
MERYKNKAVMIVGAAQGIGKTVAESYAAEGADVALFDIQDKVSQVANDIAAKQKNGGKVYAGHIDISDFNSCEKSVKATVNELGGLDVVAVVSGILPKAGTVLETPNSTWEKVINVNLNGYFYMCKAAAQYMTEKKSGNIILTGSWWGYAGHAFFASYCCSKAGVIKLTQALSEELAPYGIRINCVCPSSIKTEIHEDAIAVEAQNRGISIEEMKEIDYKKMAMRRPGTTQEIADGFLYLSSDQASYITGACLDITGGGGFR